ncbi:MAG: alpha/beta hydrolase-fold protein [Terracidiphilus sp.]
MRMGKRIAGKFTVFAGLSVSLLAFGQAAQQVPNRPAMQMPAPTPNDTLKSVEVMSDRHVRFRLWAPSATDVRLHAEGPEATPGITPQEANKYQDGVAMVKGDQGIWEAVIGPIEPGTYRYTFSVDGVSTTDPRNPLTSQSLTHSSSMYEVPGAEFMEYKAGVPHGAISAVSYDSSATGSQRRMHVYTPPGYESGTARLPVLYLLHGGGDSDDSWGTVGRAGAILDNLIAAGKAAPMMIVMPAGHISTDFRLTPGVRMGQTSSAARASSRTATARRNKAARLACGPGCVQGQAAKEKISVRSIERKSHPRALRVSVHPHSGPVAP